MFTRDFWTAENEVAYRATNHNIPSPVCGGFLASLETETEDIDLSAFEAPTADPVGSDQEIDLSAFAE